MIAVESVLQDMEQGHSPTSGEVAGVLAGAAQLLEKTESQSIIEIDIDASLMEQEINVCGDLNGQVEKLWRIFEINGEPDEDNPYIFNGDIFDNHCVELTTALFCLKLLYPDSVHILRRVGNIQTTSTSNGDASHTAALEAVTCLLPIGAMINKEVLILHADLFDEECCRAESPPTSPKSHKRSLPALLPYPSADPHDPVFLQQLKGLESVHDTTVATIRITPNSIMLPDNARFMVFRVTKQFKCVAYFGEEDEVAVKPTKTSPPTRAVSSRHDPWAKPRNDGSQTARQSQGTTYGIQSHATQSSGYGKSTYNPGSLSHRGAVPARESPPQVKMAPKLVYNSSQHTSRHDPAPSDHSSRNTQKSPPSSSMSKMSMMDDYHQAMSAKSLAAKSSGAKSSTKLSSSNPSSTHDAMRASQARSKVPSLNLGALAPIERAGIPVAGQSGIPPPNARGRAAPLDGISKATEKAPPSGSLSSRIERVAARYSMLKCVITMSTVPAHSHSQSIVLKVCRRVFARSQHRTRRLRGEVTACITWHTRHPIRCETSKGELGDYS